jgi:protein-S-isoprenylcysteine O-methyltransferase Ste14
LKIVATREAPEEIPKAAPVETSLKLVSTGNKYYHTLMGELIILLALIIIYLTSFVSRNRRVKKRVKQNIRSRSVLVMFSVLLSTVCMIITIGSVYSERFFLTIGCIGLLDKEVFTYCGFDLFFASTVFGWIVSGQLKDSWRVGVIDDQKTKLVKTGVYAYIRNPYFLSYFLMFFALFLIRPSLVFAVISTITALIFNLMVLKEEAYLTTTHGNDYLDYKKVTGRYLPKLFKAV